MSLATKHRLAHWSYSIHCALQPMPFHSFPIMTACQQRTPYSTPTMPAHPTLHIDLSAAGDRSPVQAWLSRSSCTQSRTTRTTQKHLRLGHGPQERTGADRQQRPDRTNHDHAGLDIKNGTIIDPNFLQFKLNVESTVEPSVEAFLDHSKPKPLPPGDIAKMLEPRDLCEQRSCELQL
jgi:hypothetical protein